MTPKTQADLWLELPPKTRKRHAMKAYRMLREKAEEQLKLFRKREKEGSFKDIRHLFVFITLKEFWEDLDFLFDFGKKSKWQEKAHYPVRSALDKVARLAYFTHQKEMRQKELARFEAFSSLKSCYDMSKRNQDAEFSQKIAQVYNKLKETGDPEISVSKKLFKTGAFPNMKDCMIGGKVQNADALYTQYEDLSNLSHGNYLRNLWKAGDNTHFVRSAQLGLHLANEMLRGGDFHLNGKVGQDVKDLGIQYQKMLIDG